MTKRHFRRHKPLFYTPVPKDVQNPKIKWRVLPILWMALKRLCMGLGAMVLISMLWGSYLATQIIQASAVPPLPDQMVLYINFDGQTQETPQEVSLSDPFRDAAPTVREVVAAIDEAKDDARVKGLFVRLDGARFPIAHVQEIRDAVKRFRAGDAKFAYVYSSSYGEAGGGLGGYYLASSFEQIWMQPMGVVMINGINAETPYMRSVLDKIGIEPQFFQRKDYKSAYENLTHNEMTPENRETVENLLADIRDALLGDIPAERGMSPEAFEALIDKGLFTAQQAEEEGLITHMDYADVLVEDMKVAVVGDPEAENEDVFVTLDGYIADMRAHMQKEPHGLFKDMPRKNSQEDAKPKVALVYAVGAIMPSRTGANAPAFIGGPVAAADEIAPAIIAALKDDDVQAIVLRVDSPGGSPTASESILRALERAQMKGKSVIVSMGSTAASGGYWIAAKADRIFALPTTITGSIGVIGGKFASEDLWKKLGVNWDGVKWGENSSMWSFNTPYSETEAARINMMLDQVYDGFLQRVSEGRGMSVEEVDKVAGGRVWSGVRALEVGLVDELGGLTETLNYTAQLFGKEHKSDLRIVIYPKPKTRLEQFVELLGGNSSIFEGFKLQGRIGEILAPFLQEISVMTNPELYSVYDPVSID